MANVIDSGIRCSPCWRSYSKNANWRRARRGSPASPAATSVPQSLSTRTSPSFPNRYFACLSIFYICYSAARERERDRERERETEREKEKLHFDARLFERLISLLLLSIVFVYLLNGDFCLFIHLFNSVQYYYLCIE